MYVTSCKKSQITLPRPCRCSSRVAAKRSKRSRRGVVLCWPWDWLWPTQCGRSDRQGPFKTWACARLLALLECYHHHVRMPGLPCCRYSTGGRISPARARDQQSHLRSPQLSVDSRVCAAESRHILSHYVLERHPFMRYQLAIDSCV